MVIASEVEKIVVLYQNRFTKFGYELVENPCSKYGTTNEIIYNTEKTGEQVLVEDFSPDCNCIQLQIASQQSQQSQTDDKGVVRR